ncbi:GATA transcription factor 18 [Senna tora]|uniref:GATA transcription factor 18 n=1 Tax=Senna tora TaxID=362788 RepID=A0A834WMZ8_9FABA|nr:GATA transcription factor 18 [Senna tora]
MPNHKPYDDQSDMYSSFTPSPSSSVDCTLSLGTPSTRLTQDEEKRNRHEPRTTAVPNLCWDLLHSKHTTPPQSHHTKSSRSTNNNTTNSSNDPLLARRCANCDTTSTPLWRNGPRGPKSLCNACGIRFKKEERRASAVAATTTAAANSSAGVMESAQMYNHHSSTSSWYGHSASSQKMPCLSPAMGSEFRFVDEGDREAENGIPFLSWRLNVTDRPSLVHDFTR